MIHYLGYARHLYTMHKHLQFWGDVLRDHVVPFSYERFSEERRFPPGVYIFSDIERLTAPMTHAVTQRFNALESAAEPSVLLNHPTRTMKRYELLRALYEARINAFDVFRLTEVRRPSRFPVFLRPELHVMKEKTLPLIESEAELDAATEQLHRRGVQRDDMLIVEFCDTADADGIYRKYSAFRIGDRIVPRHINFSRGWFIKSPDGTVGDDVGVEEEWQYLNENPHARALMDVFELANIEYGRIDYAVLDGRIQVWEINTNPNMGPLEEKPSRDSPRWPVQALFAREYEAALLALDPAGSQFDTASNARIGQRSPSS